MSKKQHVSVAVRIRPLLHEQLRKDQQCLSVENTRVTISLVHKLKHFDLPMVFDKNSSQQSVFQNSLLPLVQNLFQGFNCAFLCCGQNKSGKTYTIDGGNSEESKGMIQRLVDYLSLKLGSHKKKSSYLMRMSFIQIYEEQIIDLLGIRKRVSPEIVEKGRQIELKEVQFKHIHKINEIENYWIIGNRKKHLAYTKKYRNPHKSTSILTLYLQSLTEFEGVQEIRRGKLHIVDMAASKINLPNLITSPLKQLSEYNLSLNALRNVSNALVYSKASVNIPYKDSKVTLLLRQNLGGLGRTSVLFHLIPTLNEYSSSLDSLRLAKLLMQVQNEVYCDIHSTKSIIVCRTQQLHQCKRKLEQIDRQINAKKQKQLNIIQKQGQQNQFLSQSLLQERHQEPKSKIKGLINQKIRLKKNIQNIESLFLMQKFQVEKEVIYKSKYKDLFLRKNKDVMALSQGSSRGFNGYDSSETNAFKDKNRNHFQEIFDLQTEFQQERQLLLEKIRKLQGQFKFYEKVSLQTVKKQEIDILRGSSRYDSTKRAYEVPPFIVREKKLSYAQKMFESHRKTLSERKFIMIKSLSERDESLNKRREQLCENLDEIKKENERELKEKIKQSQKRRTKERKQKQLNTQYFPNYTIVDQVNKLHNVTHFSKLKQHRKGDKVSKSLTRLRFK